MKSKTLIAGYSLLLVMLLGIAVLIIQTQPTIVATLKINPSFVSLEELPEDEFGVIIELPKPYKTSDINASTVYVEGVLQNCNPDMPRVTPKNFKIKVDGPSFVYLLAVKIGHMGPGIKVPVTVTVTGELNDGTPFQGTDEITVMTAHIDPHPNP